MELSGKTAVITGASGGIGQAVARNLASAGARLVLHGSTRSDRLEKLAADTNGDIVTADLRITSDIEDMFTSITANHASIDVLVNSAAVEDVSDDPLDTSLWHELFAINLFAIAENCRHALKVMNRGVIVNLSSGAGSPNVAYAPNSLSYAISKAGVEKMTTQLAAMVAPNNRVVGISPGYVLSPMWGDLSEDDIRTFAAKVPLGRFTEPDETAQAIRAVIENDMITGVTIPVDAGLGVHRID